MEYSSTRVWTRFKLEKKKSNFNILKRDFKNEKKWKKKKVWINNIIDCLD